MVDYKKWDAKKKNTILSGYALDSIKYSPADAPKEDFAEALAAYRYRPNYLKQISQEKYDFIKEKVFNGVVYDSEEDCINEPIIEVSDFVKKKYNYSCTHEKGRPYLRRDKLVKACYEFIEKSLASE